ncbi:MAG TPA: biotin/lipoyl-binding protein, partial [Acidobacteriota bacterium]|nr:biotin/lipoyl-binding protein [Acidobacteriota bacterium]
MALSRSKKILVIGGIVVLLGGITAASVLSRNRNAVPVQFDTVKRFEILESKVSASGEIRPKELYNLTAEVSGRVTSIKVTEGQLVKKDQPLIEVDPTQQATAKASAEANYQAAIQEKLQVQQQLFSAENNVNQTKNLLAGAQADLRRARATQDLNQKELNNLSKLVETGIVSKIEIDRASANLETAKAAVEAQEEQVKRLQTQVKDAEISVDRMKAALAGSEQREKSSKANLDSANDILNKTIKLAPID